MLNNTNDFKLPLLTGKIVNGIVEENNDPLHFGRIKVRVENLHSEKMKTEDLPWVMSLNYTSAVKLQGGLKLPDIGSKCWVLYTSDDLYSGIYVGCLPNITEDFLQHYPNTYGFIDRSGTLFLVDTETDNYTFYHVSGTTLTVDAKGQVRLQVANNQVNPDGLANNPQPLSLEVVGNVDLTSSENVSITCKQFNLKASNGVNIDASTNLNISSNNATENYSSLTQNIGSYTISASSYTLQSGGVLTVTGGGALTLGGTSVQLNGLSFAPTQIIDTNMSAQIPWSFNCFGAASTGSAPPAVPPSVSPTSPSVNTVNTPNITPPNPRERQKGVLENG